MDSKTPPSVRFRMVFEMTFPDADPWDPADYRAFIDGVKSTIENAPNVRCTDVRLREAATVGSADDYEQWRGGWKIDFSSFSSGTGFVEGVRYPVPAVDAEDVANVWRVLEDAETNGFDRRVNLAISLGQRLRPETDAQAVIARVFSLRVLQGRGTVPREGSPALFEKAATFPLEQRPIDEAAVEGLAQLLLPKRAD